MTCINRETPARSIIPGMRPVMLASLLVLALAGCGGAPQPAAPPAVDLTRGRELYQTYCIACHTAQVHWRDQSLVRSWEDLRAQVTRFQGIAGQRWSTQDIDDVAAYLNRLFYQVPCPLAGCGGPAR